MINTLNFQKQINSPKTNINTNIQYLVYQIQNQTPQFYKLNHHIYH